MRQKTSQFSARQEHKPLLSIDVLYDIERASQPLSSDVTVRLVARRVRSLRRRHKPARNVSCVLLFSDVTDGRRLQRDAVCDQLTS